MSMIAALSTNLTGIWRAYSINATDFTCTQIC